AEAAGRCRVVALPRLAPRGRGCQRRSEGPGQLRGGTRPAACRDPIGGRAHPSRSAVKRTAVALGLALAACAPRPKLVEWGWDEPDPAFMRRHVAEMAATPFDGCVFHVGYLKPGGGRGSLSWEMWGRRALDEA